LFINYYLVIILSKQWPSAQWIHLPAGWRTSTHSVQRMERTASQLSRLYHKGPVASKFAECKSNQLSHMGCNVEGILQA